jgi:hypothetical protein
VQHSSGKGLNPSSSFSLGVARPNAQTLGRFFGGRFLQNPDSCPIAPKPLGLRWQDTALDFNRRVLPLDPKLRQAGALQDALGFWFAVA